MLVASRTETFFSSVVETSAVEAYREGPWNDRAVSGHEHDRGHADPNRGHRHFSGTFP